MTPHQPTLSPKAKHDLESAISSLELAFYELLENQTSDKAALERLFVRAVDRLRKSYLTIEPQGHTTTPSALFDKDLKQ